MREPPDANGGSIVRNPVKILAALLAISATNPLLESSLCIAPIWGNDASNLNK